MTIQIYGGCEIVGHTLESFLKHAQRIRPAMIEVARHAARSFVVNCATHNFDLHHLGLETEKPRSFIGEAATTLMDRQDEVERTRRRDPMADFASDVVLFPVAATKSAPARLLATTFIEHPELYKAWTSQPFWRDFSYWDNSDGPDELPRREWTARKRMWAQIFPGRMPPSQVGFTLNLVRPIDAYHEMTDELLAPHLSTLHQRAHVLVDYFMKDIPAELALPPDATRAQKREALQPYLESRLVPALTIAQLRNRPE